jgi:Uma2 family endonuclease
MNVQLPVHMDKAEFLAWVEGQEGRFELVRGHVVMMVGASRGHARIVMNIAQLLRAQLNSHEWEAIAEFGLDAGPETLRYPDIVIDRAGGADRDRTAMAPAVLIEILSPSSQKIDLRDKTAEYLQLPSLQAYLVVAQDEARAWLWTRSGGVFPDAPIQMIGLDEAIRLDVPRLVLPLTEIYAGVRTA